MNELENVKLMLELQKLSSTVESLKEKALKPYEGTVFKGRKDYITNCIQCSVLICLEIMKIIGDEKNE